jgi:hypothetical protein
MKIERGIFSGKWKVREEDDRDDSYVKYSYQIVETLYKPAYSAGVSIGTNFAAFQACNCCRLFSSYRSSFRFGPEIHAQTAGISRSNVQASENHVCSAGLGKGVLMSPVA